jgi:hypothetical protein
VEIRKFIFSIVSTFNAKGFKEADKAADAAGKTAARTAKYWAVLAKEQLAAARAAEQAARAQTAAAGAAEQAAVKTSAASAAVKRATKTSGDGLKEASEALDEYKKGFAGIGTLASAAAVGLGAFITAGVAVATGVIRTGASFESLRTQLTTLTGSSSAGSAAFAQIKEFAKNTPFEVDGVTKAFIGLKTRGVLPTTDTLTSLGDLSSSFGGNLESITDAISAAARGENDPLERYGLSAKASGDKVILSFRDQKVAVEKNAAAITAALVEFGKLEGIQGAMAAQSQTTNGVISNLKDSFSQFLDEVAQLGVLDEFKLLLTDLIGLGGPGNGFAGIVADFLVTGLRSLRETLAQVTEEDIRSFLQGMANAAVSLVDVVDDVVAAFRFVTEVSGGTSDALMNMALVAFALTAALSGPAGLVLAAGAVGLAMGNMAANILSSSTAAEVARAQIEMYSNSISEIEGRLNEIDKRVAANNTKHEEDRKKRLKDSNDRIQAELGGLGGGLAAAESPLVRDTDAIFEAGALRAGGERQERARARFATAEGQAVLAAVDKAAQRQADRAAANARREASARGATASEISSAEANARRAASQKAQANRKKALEAASESFAATGSAEKAARAGENIIEAAEKKATGGGKGGKAKDDPYDLMPKFRAEAKSQAAKFSEQEFERLVGMGVSTAEASQRTIEAARAKEEELTAAFVKAGKTFDVDADNILSVLGLNGPGSVLQGRPPPATLIIAPHIEVTMIEHFEQNIAAVTGADALTEITGQGGEAAAGAGLEKLRVAFQKIVDDTIALRMEELAEADGDGETPG